MTLTSASLFCGAGGDFTGFVEAGFDVVLGANHDPVAIDTVSTNHAGADFLCADINHYDMRRLRRTDVLWASVICTESSPAGGHKKRRGQGMLPLEEFGHISSATFERTRACALDVIRATEVHRYLAVVVENVVEFARDWELYDWWVEGMCKLGYQVQVVNASAAHIYDADNPPAPQWRDRIFIVFTRNGVPAPDLEPRPPAWCERCDQDVDAIQWWKRSDRRRIGKYHQQYLYRCPRCSDVVEPYVLPAVAALDLSDVGERIGDRARPLSPTTMARIAWGLEHLAWPLIAQVAGNTFERPGYHRAWPAAGAPLTTRQATGTDALVGPVMVNHAHEGDRVYRAQDAALYTATQKIGEGFATAPAPFLTMLRANNNAMGIDEPLATMATGRHHYLTTPPGAFVVQHYGADPKHCSHPVEMPLTPITTTDHHSLVVPYRKGTRPHWAADAPLGTQATHTAEGILRPAIDPLDCHYRTLRPKEHKAAQRFPGEYVITGNVGQQTAQAGNAVAVNCAHWIGKKLLEVLA